MNRVLTAVLCLALALTVSARTASDEPIAFANAMKLTSLKFAKDKDGDFKTEIVWKSEKRSQLVYVRGKAMELMPGSGRMRQVWSQCWRGRTADAAVMKKLLLARPKIGAFQLASDLKGGFVAYLRIDLPEDIRPSTLDNAIEIVATFADNIEKDLMAGKDDF